jgi:hypothetical protein
MKSIAALNWSHYYVDGHRQFYQPYIGKTGNEHQAYSPLLSRGWALQERLLASRYVHFTAEELVWECRNCTTCECKFLATSESDWRRSQRDVAGFKTSKVTFDNILGSSVRISLFREWLEIVEAYTGKGFTYRQDLLPGLSGLAKQLQQQGTGEYLAGLWKDDLLYGLL